MKLNSSFYVLISCVTVSCILYTIVTDHENNTILFGALPEINSSQRYIQYPVLNKVILEDRNANASSIAKVQTLQSNPTFRYESSLQSVNSTSSLPARALWSNLRQYNEGIVKVPVAKLKARRGAAFWPISHYKRFPPSNPISDLRFDVVTSPKIRLRLTYMYDVVIRVKDRRNNKTVPGCNFSARRVGPMMRRVGSRKGPGPGSGEANERLVAECSVESLPDQSHVIRCPDYSAIAAPCYQLTIRLQFCNYQAYVNAHIIVSYNHTVFDEELCSNTTVGLTSADSRPFTPPSWTTTQGGRCNEMILENFKDPIGMMSPHETCACVKSFTNVYLLGTSHIRYFGDYLMHTCYGRNLTGVASLHGDLAETVQYYAWCLYNNLNINVHKYIDSWLLPNTSIAIWMQLGSRDFSAKDFDTAIDFELPIFNRTLAYIKSRIAKQRHLSTTVDLRVLGSPAMPIPWHRNNFAVGAFNAKLEMIVRHHGIHYTDVFSQTVPCISDLPVPFSNNHYFYRDHENNFGGQSGKNIYFRAFLPQVCPVLGSK